MVFNRFLKWSYKPIIGCAKCHAVWIAVFSQLIKVFMGWEFGFGNALMILGASYGALLLDDFAEIRDKWKNQ